MIELHKLDSDILVGHNISGFDLDVLLNRVKVEILTKSYLCSAVYLFSKTRFHEFKDNLVL